MTADASNDIQRRRNLPSYEENAAVDELSEMLHHLSIHGYFMSSLDLDGESETACNELIEFDNNEQFGSPQVDDDEIISEAIAESEISAEEIESESDLDNSVISYVSESSTIQSIDNLRTYLSCCVAGTDVESYAVTHQLLDHLVQVHRAVVRIQKKCSKSSWLSPKSPCSLIKSNQLLEWLLHSVLLRHYLPLTIRFARHSSFCLIIGRKWTSCILVITADMAKVLRELRNRGQIV